MITKNDCILLLTSLQEKGLEVKSYIINLMSEDDLNLDVLKFINDNRELELSKFYEKIRKNHNQKKSNLYGNIVKEIEEPQEVIITLSAMLTQILLYSKKLENKKLFLTHARANEITQVLNNYFDNYDIKNALKLMKVIKADIKCLESLKD